MRVYINNRKPKYKCRLDQKTVITCQFFFLFEYERSQGAKINLDELKCVRSAYKNNEKCSHLQLLHIP